MRLLALGQFNLSRNFLTLLADNGHQVAYGHLGKPAMPEPRPDLPVFAIRQTTRLDDIRAAIAAHAPDALLVGSAGYDGSNALAYELLEVAERPPMIRFYKEFMVKASPRERDVLMHADGVVLHAESAFGYFQAIYGLTRERVHIYDHDMIADRLVPAVLPERLSQHDGEPHIALGGTLKLDGSGYDYRELITALSELGIHVHVYAVAYSKWLSVGRALDPDSAEVRDAYMPLASRSHVHFETPVTQAEQCVTLARHDAGIMQVTPRSYVPEVTPWHQMDHPSKYSYYLSAGLPLTLERGTGASLRTHLGQSLLVEYTSPEDLACKLRDPELMAERQRAVAERRGEFRLGHGLAGLLSFVGRVLSPERPSYAPAPARIALASGADGAATRSQSKADSC
jgi:hypothetical protein